MKLTYDQLSSTLELVKQTLVFYTDEKKFGSDATMAINTIKLIDQIRQETENIDFFVELEKQKLKEYVD